MTIDIEKEVDEEFDFQVDELIRSVIEKCIYYEACPYEAKVMVILTDNESIREINKNHRQIDSVTDVLSFPMIEYKEPGNLDFLEDDDDGIFDSFDPDTGELVLGDIVISVDRAKEQAKEYGHSLKREIGFLVAHSMFHLFGYDHMEEAEREDMERRQRDVLEQLGVVR